MQVRDETIEDSVPTISYMKLEFRASIIIYDYAISVLQNA
jgi:hypothetical protein